MRSEYPSIWITRYMYKVVVWTSGLLEDIEDMNTTFNYRSNPFSLRDDSRDGGGRTKFGTRVEKARMRG